MLGSGPVPGLVRCPVVHYSLPNRVAVGAHPVHHYQVQHRGCHFHCQSHFPPHYRVEVPGLSWDRQDSGQDLHHQARGHRPVVLAGIVLATGEVVGVLAGTSAVPELP